MATIANVFGPTQIAAQQYGPETVLYTWGPATLNVGRTQVFSTSNWNTHAGPTRECTVSYLAASQVAGVALQWTLDSTTTNPAQFWVSGFRSGVQANPGSRLSALTTMGLVLANTSGAAIPNFVLNYAITVKPLTLADKIVRGIALNDQDQLDLRALSSQNGVSAIQGLMMAVTSGQLPKSDRDYYDAIWAGRRLRDNMSAVPTILNSTAASANITLSPPNGQTVQVLQGLRVEGAPDCVITVRRDGDLNYLAINAGALLAADDATIPLWIPSLQAGGLVIAAIGSKAAVNVWPLVSNYATSDRLLAHMQVNIPSLTTYAKVRAGWL